MNNNSFDLKEIQEAAIKFAKDHPFGALLAVAAITGISKGVAEGMKSMAFSMELRADDRTLTDTDSEGVISNVLAALKEQLDAVLR